MVGMLGQDRSCRADRILQKLAGQYLGNDRGEHARTQVAGRMAMGEPGTLQAEQESRPRLSDMDDPARRHPHDAAAALAVIAFTARPAERAQAGIARRPARKKRLLLHQETGLAFAG